ncbi:nuclear transport factor 2 family protein [Rhizobium sp. S-51]|uniref:Nuclear transport factor 2 family protein n=1 Tax=Rhizobium terricola TaxID=2728849 RepID=A0A7Y0AUJ8_9HYPH|nr:nuclear transport factor 2 family protein [Rhizobium terricola]NML73777.1 nuclear transport factor 2 family protein [Rhizobium terricola]
MDTETKDQVAARFDDEQLALWEHVSDLWEIARRRETGPVRRLLHRDYTGWVTGLESPHDYEAAVASVGPDTPRVLRYRLRPLTVRIFDHEVGVVHYGYEAEVEAHGEGAKTIAGRWTEVYKRRGADWLMIAVSGGPDGMR